MSFLGQQQENGVIRDPDRERQEQTLPKCLPPKWIVNEGPFWWCVLSVIVDPLFFYVPVINEERKCIALDKRLYISITCLRTVLDSILLLHIIWRCLRHFENARPRRGRGESQDRKPKWAEMTGTEKLPKLLKLLLWLCRFLSWYRKAQPEFCSLPIDVLAILPIPQVLLPIIFSKLRGSESLNKRKVLTAVLLFQYLPRAFLIHQLSVPWRKAFSQEVQPQDGRPSKHVIAVKAGLNLFMFIVASHILGGFWYFFSIEQETACWHLACENHIECNRSSFDCNDRSVGNYTFLNDYCPIQNPNTTAFDFGIFQGALQSGTVASTDTPRKILYCFWWGLRNLSSFGSNLQTSPNIWENCFAILTSISGLLLFMYYLGRLQVPLLQNEGDYMLNLISGEFLRHVYYNENSYIVREGEPLDALLFITRGIVWTYTTSPDHRQTGCLKTDDFYGVELLEWVFNSPFLPDPSNLPFSTRTLRCHTKVEAFAFTAGSISKFKEIRYPILEQRERIMHLPFRRRRNARQMTQDEFDHQKAKKAAS